MALDSIPPWLDYTPQTFLGAAEAGASLGLRSSESGDRLKLAYDQLAQQERQQARATAARIQLGQAANALRAQHENALLEHYAAIRQNSERMAKASEAAAALRGVHYDPSQGVFKRLNQDGTVDTLGEPKPAKESQGSLEYDAGGNIKSARGLPDSTAVKTLQQSIADKAAIGALPKANRLLHPFSRPKLTMEQAQQFKTAAKGDKDKARQLARDAGFDF